MVKKKINGSDIVPEEDDDLGDVDPEEINEENSHTRSVQISALNINVVVASDDPKDDLNKLKNLAEYLVDKYKGC